MFQPTVLSLKAVHFLRPPMRPCDLFQDNGGALRSHQALYTAAEDMIGHLHDR